MIAIIDYGAGNTASVANALERLKCKYIITKFEEQILSADKIILPGVGESSFAIKQLYKNNLINLLRVIKKPLLGICLGMQLLCEFSEEGNIACLGQVEGRAVKFDNNKVNVPHIGWNEVFTMKESPLFKGIKEGEFFYFAHSYYLPVCCNTVAYCEYGEKFSAAVEKNNLFGLQFHPEKSGEAGLRMLKNFVEL
jgi:glutamine amidotransferase